MSFIAHGPEQIYRYVLRLDKRERSLSDRFGFSIVLVNDDSDVCTQLLLEYFAKLSHRTAHRVRFVFFAEMTEAEESDRLMSATGHLTPGWYRRFFRGPRWDELRPDALELVAKPQELLNEWLEKSTIPDNTGAASRFAERLGVANHMPCLLMFNDVGDRSVHVMRLGRVPDARQVFEHVCQWVDEFYRDNLEALARWDKAEDRIRDLCAQVKTTLGMLDTWRRSTSERAQEMRELAIAIGALENLKNVRREAWRQEWSSRLNGLRNRAARERLADVDKAIQALTAFHALEEDALVAADELRNAPDDTSIARAVERLLTREVLDGVEQSRLHGQLESLRDEAAAVRSMDPQQQLDRWRAAAPRWPSRDEYVGATAEWASRHPARRLPDEYSFLISKLLRQSVAARPEEGARAVLEEHARRFAADDLDDWWKGCGPLQQLIETYLQRVVTDAPPWLVASPEIILADALKGHETADAISRERDLHGAEIAAASERLLEHARDLKEQALAAIAALVPSCKTRPEHVAALVDRHLPALRDARHAVEEELRGMLQTARGWWTTPIDAEQVREVTAVLDEYDAAIGSLSFPYQRDPLVIEVPTLLSVPAAANVAPSADGPHDTRARFVSAIDAQENGARALAEIERLIPVCGLEQTLTAVVSSQRLEQLLAGGGGARDVVDRLSPEERDRVCQQLHVVGHDISNPSDTGRLILGAIGADPARGEITSGAIPDHDVFISYPNVHKTIIERIAHVLSELGLRPWLDAWEIAPGTEFKAAIARALDRCRACAVFVGPEGIGPWQEIELDAAFEGAKRGLRVIPVLLGSAGRDQLPVILRRFSSVQIADAADRRAIERLGRGLRSAATVV
jgi:hypothetical protein